MNAEFTDTLNLARGAIVKVNGVTAGKVSEVTLKDFVATARITVQKDAQIRDSATARLRYTTPLGELYVDVVNPGRGQVLPDGATMPLARTSTAPTVENALSQASMLINGGGLNHLQTVTEEINAAIGGREATVKQLLSELDTFMTQANASRGEIDQILTALSGVSQVLNRNERTINRALQELRPLSAVLRKNTPGFAQLLRSTDRFADVANDVVARTRAEILQLLREVTPVLNEFLANQKRIAPSLRGLIGMEAILDDNAPGDYLNITLDLDSGGLLEALLGVENPLPFPRQGGESSARPQSGQAQPESGNPVGELLGGLTGGTAELLNGLLGGNQAQKGKDDKADLLGLSRLLGGAGK